MKEPNAPVYFYELDDHPMFPPAVTAVMRFVRPAEPLPCVECGKVTRRLWTMLIPFRALASFSGSLGEERAALTLVCDEHPLAPAERFEVPLGLKAPEGHTDDLETRTRALADRESDRDGEEE